MDPQGTMRMGMRAADEIFLQIFGRWKPEGEVIAKPRNLKKEKQKKSYSLRTWRGLTYFAKHDSL